MANEIKITRATALKSAIELFPADAPEVEVLGKLLASITKRSSTAGQPTKTAIANGATAEKIIAHMDNGVAYTGSQLQVYGGVQSSQKLTAILRPLVANGTIIREVVKGKVLYRLG